MKKYFLKFATLCIALSITLYSCDDTPSEEGTDTPEEETIVDDGPDEHVEDNAPLPDNPHNLPEGQYELMQYSESVDDCPVGASDCAYFLMEFPKLKLKSANNAAINAQVKDWLLAPIDELGTAGKNYQEHMNLYLQQYLNTKDAEGYIRPWFMERKAIAKTNLDKFVSFEFNQQTYSGGAQDVTFTIMVTYRKSNGKRVDLTEVLVEGQDDALRAAINKRLRIVLGLNEDESLKKKGFNDDNIDMTQNLALQDGAITFYYNAGELGPYSLGSTQLTFALDELGGIIKPWSEI